MAAFTEENLEQIFTVCGENAAALAESLSQCVDRKYRLVTGDSGMWSEADLAEEFRGPGLVTLIQVESQAIAVLIPATLPLPGWYRQPNDSQTARLETLAMEWSMNLIPATLEAGRFKTLTVENLGEAIHRMSPSEWSATLTLRVFDVAASDETPVANLLVVWPLEQPQFENLTAGVAPPEVSFATSAAPPAALQPPKRDPLARLRHLPVQISVRLAEKKIPMSQLLGITPGMLITFNKSCDDLLELYVNNAHYCRGEAVKIGENFGLKINQVGISEEPHAR